MNPAVGIRPATAGDLDAVECVERRSFPEGEAFTRRQLRYSADACAGSVLRRHPRRCGRRLHFIADAAHGAKPPHLLRGGGPAARGCGAGQALLDAAIALARRLGLREVTLEVRTDNDSAIRLYARNGFRPGKLLRGYYPDDTDARRMSFKSSCGRPE
ncbi:MAG: GNAT family N-acetyltransferase [Alistipes shahii]